MSKYPGKFFVVDGTDGAGKSEQIKLLKKHLESLGHEVITTREPGGTPMAEEIRHLFKSEREEHVDPVTESMLMWSARRQHIVNVIEPWLKRGAIVISDRMLASTFAYQVHGRGVNRAQCFDPFLTVVMGDVWPDKTIIIDVPPEVAKARSINRGAMDRLDGERLEFFERVRVGYKEYAEFDSRAVVIDGDRSIAEVSVSVREQIREHLPVIEQDHSYPALA